jgi:phosphate transport system permease protein
MTPLAAPPAPPGPARATAPRRRPAGQPRRTALFAHGEPSIWLTGGALAIALLMIIGLLGYVGGQGLGTFWPGDVVRLQLKDGTLLAGELTRVESFTPAGATTPERRRLLRIGNFELTGERFRWVEDRQIESETRPSWFLVVERQVWGRFYGEVQGFERDGQTVARTPTGAWEQYEAGHGAARDRLAQRRELETSGLGALNRETEEARLAAKAVELKHGAGSAEAVAASAQADAVSQRLQPQYAAIRAQIDELNRQNDAAQLVLATADGRLVKLGLDDIVRAYPANSLGFGGKLAVYLSRWWEFLSDVPREANSEGGVWPAIFGTVMMTLVMSLLVVPFGVLAALYLREYARPGVITSAVRIAVNNLAGVPSIVFGVFGLGFFCYIVGGRIDALFFPEKLPSPTFGTGGILWASLTLALLTLPVVIVATEEALAAVPGSMREGSYACGASKWQTIRRIVLPRALPGIMTGMILALARGAGEVAPLMLVGASKLAPEMPFDGHFPFLHLQRSFMHLGFHIFDLGFQSPDSEAARPMVFTTTLLLIGIVVVLNVTAVIVRARLRSRYVTGKF